MRPAEPRTRPAGTSGRGEAPTSARDRLAARIAAIEARHGKAAEPEQPIEPADAPTSVGEAEANLSAVLPVESVERWHQRKDGRWADSTGAVLPEGETP